MKPGWQHANEAITTDQKNLAADEHIHEQEKQELTSNDSLIPKKGAKTGPIDEDGSRAESPAKK